MADGIVSFPLPQNPIPSTRFRDRFNDVATELKLGVQWTRDSEDPLQVNANELEVDQAQWQKYSLAQKVPTVFSKALADDVKRVLKEVEQRRLVAVKEAAHAHEYVTVKISLQHLSPAEKEAVRRFNEVVKPLINAIEARQQRPNVNADQAYLQKYGDMDTETMASHSPYETCLGFGAFDPKCSPLPYFPDRPILNGMIAPEIGKDEFLNLGKTLPANAEELRPTTVLEKREGRLVAIPLPKHPAFADDHVKLAQSLDDIAKLRVEGKVLDPSLIKQLKAWATFFRSGSAKDEATAVQATIDAGEGKGHLRVHIGPSESYWDDNTKFPYNLQVGVRNPEVAAELGRAKGRFLKMEAMLTGIPHYKPRSLSTRGGFADPIYQVVTGGFIDTFPLFEPMGNNFPNYAAYNAKGSNRFILLESVNGILPARIRVAEKVSDESVEIWKLPAIFPTFVINHESGHLLGPQRDHVTPKGKMGAVFGEHWGSADEPKADLVSGVMAYQLQQEGRDSHVEVENLVRPHFVHLMTRYKGKAAFTKLRDHYFGVMMEVGFFYRAGVLTRAEVPGGAMLHIDYEKWPEVAYKLWREIVTYQAKGDLDGYLAFAKEAVHAIPDDIDRLILEANKGIPLYFVERQLEY